MPEHNGATEGRSADDEEGGRIWQGLKSLLFPKANSPTLREQLEVFIDEHEGNPTADALAGDLSGHERELLRNLLHFSEITAGEAGVPRADIIAIEEKAEFSEAISLFAEHGHSRIPVYRENLDQVVGMVHIKDVFSIMAEGQRMPKRITSLIRQPLYVPESMGVLELLEEMRRRQMHLAIVLDEYSGTERLITIEDLVEEIFGEIADEHDDAPTLLIQPIIDGNEHTQIWEVDARAELDEVADAVGDQHLADVDEDIDTIGGLAVILAGCVPEIGTLLTSESGWRLEILEGDEKRVSRIRLHAPPPEGKKSDA